MRNLRRVRLTIVFLILAVVLTLSAIANEFAADEPRQIILTWQNNPQTTMTITWRTDVEGERSVAFFSSEKTFETEGAEFREAETYTFAETAAWLHTVELTELIPGKTYWVVLQTDDSKSEVFSFRTAPAEPEDITFAIGADAQHLRTQMHVIREVHRKVAQEDPDFFVYSGDFVNAELSDYEWDLFFDLWHELMITDEGRRVPLIPAIGNHEVVAGYGGSKELAVFYFNRFKIPEPEKYHVIQFGPDLTIISLDSGHSSTVDGEQLLWLERTLQEYSDSEWVIAHYHDGGWWSSGAVPVKIRCFWVPLFEEYGVDLVHSGHIHAYMNTLPILGLGEYARKIDSIIEEGLARAKEDFEPGKNYAPPLQPNLLQLSRGNWEALGFSSLTEGLRELTYMLSLFVIQTGEATKLRVFDQISATQLFAQFWAPLLASKSYRDDALVDEKEGVLYMVGGGLGAELSTVISADNRWWLEDSRAVHHFRLVSIDASRNELKVLPVFYCPDEKTWEEGEPFVRRK